MRRQFWTDSFTLIELLVVVGIIALIASLAVGAFNNIGGGVNLTNGANMVVDELDFARQTAISSAQTVEVRLYSDKRSSNASMFQGYNWDTIISLIPANGSIPNSRIQWIEKPNVLPTGIIFDTTNGESTYSTLITSGTVGTASPVLVISGSSAIGTPPVLQGEDYVSFHFRPDGSTDLPWGQASQSGPTGQSTGTTQPWCVTLRAANGPQGLHGAPAPNFITILLDPVLGRTRTFQPH